MKRDRILTMRIGYRLKRATGWLMLGLALLTGLAPDAFAGVADHPTPAAGARGDHAAAPAGAARTADDHHLPASHQHGDTCADHCCSDACSAALSLELPLALAVRSPMVDSATLPSAPFPTERRFIPPRRR